MQLISSSKLIHPNSQNNTFGKLFGNFLALYGEIRLNYPSACGLFCKPDNDADLMAPL